MHLKSPATEVHAIHVPENRTAPDAAIPFWHPCDEIEDCVNEELEAGNPCVFKADTIEELAEQMDIDPAALIATIDTYNGYVDTGEDPAYHKDPQYLVKVQTAPFYGARLCTNVLSTFGGIRVNKNMEVVTADEGTAIPSLYAAGIDRSGFTGETYGIVMAGSTQAVAWAAVASQLAAP